MTDRHINTTTNSSAPLSPSSTCPQVAFACEHLNAAQLATRLNLKKSWITERVRTKPKNPIPHVRFGSYTRFSWGSMELAEWLGRHMVAGRHKSATTSPQDVFSCKFLDSAQLASKFNLPETWIRDCVRERAVDPIPHLKLGKYVRFLWLHPDLEAWLNRRIVVGHNSKVVRPSGKELVQ